MDLGTLIRELESEFNKTDFDISVTHLISGILQNLFKEKNGVIAKDEMLHELQLMLTHLRDYNLQRKKVDVA